MKTIFLVSIVLLFQSCATNSSNLVKFVGGNKHIFQHGDHIYVQTPISDDITFYDNEDEIVKSLDADRLKLADYKIEYKNEDKTNTDYFESFLRNNSDASLTPSDIVRNLFDRYEKVLRGDEWNVTGGVYPKELVINKIKLTENTDYKLTTKEYKSPVDSLRIEIKEPADLNIFCKKFKEEYPDADFFILFQNVYITRNIFRISLAASGTPFSTGFYDFDAFEGVVIAPKIVIDINQSKIVAIDTRRYNVREWYDIKRSIFGMIEDDAEFYNLKF